VPLAAAAGTGAVGLVGALVTDASIVVVGAIAGVTAALLAVVSLFTAAARVAPRRRRTATAWRWLAAGAIAWLFGIGLRPVAASPSFVVTFTDLTLLVGTLLLAVGCAMTVHRPVSVRSVLRHVTDAYLSAASLFVISWVVVLASLYAEIGEPGAFVVTLALPMTCLIAVCAVGPAVVTGRASGWPVGPAGLAVLVAITVAEMATAVARLAGEEPPSAGVWLAPVAFLLLAAAPWSGRRSRPADGDADADVADTDVAEVRQSGHVLAPLLVSGLHPMLVVAATVILAAHVMGGRPHAPPLAVTLVAASVVVVLVVRLSFVLLENARMRGMVAVGERQLRELAESTGDVVLVCDHEGVVHEVGAGVETTYGYRPDEVLGGSLFDYIHPEDVPGIQAALRDMSIDDESAEPAGPCLIACRVRAVDGTWRPTESVATRNMSDGEDLVLVTVRDVSDEEALRNQVAHLTFHDGVTGLPNRAYFEERTREVLVGRGPGPTAVIFLDLDGFTAVNDSVGHTSGDHLLGQAARRLRSAVRSDDTLARWGGDEFAVLVEAGGEVQAVVDLAERLVRAVSQEPFRIADRDVALTASVGVAFAEDGVPSGDLIRNADVAMARAKELGGRRVEVFAAHMHADVVRRLELAADLQRALLENQFAIEYQPIVDLATSRVTSVEALVRWWRGSTFVPPDQFLGPAEDTGLIVPLSEWILRESCREVAAWRASSWDIGLSINLSARQITAPRFVETVSEALADSGLPPSALTLEVIEEMLVEDADETIGRLSELRALGVRLAIDDFGTGYASLAFLRQLPVDMIKIDPSFVAGLGCDETLTLLTRTIVRLGHDLGLIVVAEGIERPEQLELLREMGCTKGQGYLVARPMAAPGVDSLMRTNLTSLQNTA
jgi:diguanylate cyclase (GGDEF)-like protein/PAS domain S-box-containing protein